MTSDLREKQTTINVQEKANLIWAIADKLVGVYKPHEYGIDGNNSSEFYRRNNQ